MSAERFQRSAEGFQQIRISIEANIGAGKSEFINNVLKQTLNDHHVKYINHSLTTWQEQNLLKNFYENPARWTYFLETRAMVEKIKNYDSTGPVCIFHRSWMTNRMIFAPVLKDLGCITCYEESALNNLFNIIVQTAKPIHYIIYLRTSPDECFTNVQSRRREEELGLRFEYIQLIHQNLESWLGQVVGGQEEDTTKVIIIDNHRNIESSRKILLEEIPELEQFLR